jgi:hypothetical protein
LIGFAAILRWWETSESLILPILRRQQVNKDAMVEEYNPIMNNDVWEVVSRHEGKSMVNSRWLYKIKYDTDGNIEKFKVWFVS